MEITVRDILRMPFFLRSASENLKIILKGKPRPKIFNSEWFDKEQWLTACDKDKAFFCWPCLLFVQENSEWNKKGFYDVDNLFAAFEEHKSTPPHIRGVLKLQLFLNENLVPVTTARPEIKTLVKSNRNVVKRIVDTVCHMANIKTPVSNGISVCDQHLVDDCIKYLRVLKTYDLHNSCDEAINLIMAQDSKVLSDVVSTLTKLISTEIKNEVQSSSYVSLIFSEHSEINLKAKLSNVLRYVKDGKVLERFIGFSHCIAYKSSNLMLSNISGIVSKFDICKKLFSISCDGSVMSMKHLKAVLMSLQRDSLCFQFVPCYYHDFDFVLQQSVSGFQECHLFFQNLRSMKSYLQDSFKIRAEFNVFMNDSIPNFCDLKLSDSQFLRVLRLHRREFIKFFNGIQIKHIDYRPEELAKASGFVKLLQELQTIFLLESFYVLFECTAIFSETLSSRYPENVFEKSFIENIQTALRSKREEGFLSIWSLTMAALTELPEKPGRELEQFKRRFFFQLHNKVMDHLASEIEIRFNFLERLNFFHMLNYECQGKFIVSDDYLENLMVTFGHCIDKTLLKTELNIISSNSTELVGNNIYDLLQTLVSKKLENVFQNVVNLAELILSMPCKPPSSTGNTSKYNLINSWSAVLGNGNMLDEFSVLAIERDLLQHVISQTKFYDEFMSTFQTMNNTLQVT